MVRYIDRCTSTSNLTWIWIKLNFWFAEFSSVWVSTNDPEVKEYVTKNKPLVQVHDRAWYTATDEASSLMAVQEFLSFHPGWITLTFNLTFKVLIDANL